MDHLEGYLTPRRANLSGEVNRAEVVYEKDYNILDNKPQIESVELIGNRELEEIGVDHLSIEDLIHILD